MQSQQGINKKKFQKIQTYSRYETQLFETTEGLERTVKTVGSDMPIFLFIF
jgi:hypothetical protein